jgi:D-alanyl-lipoteichoic acid acyltransferase DltB (MBOAT superfamily)
MLFNSISFICVFLPITLLLFFILGGIHQRAAMVWLGIASLVFYSWLGTNYLLLLVVSIIFNYSAGHAMEKYAARERVSYWLLVFGVSVNLLTLIYYKYLFDLTGWAQGYRLSPYQFGSAILPLGISFFTFTQIGYLVDRRAGVTKSRNFIEYVLFVTFFPHLIAGPILHHREIMPQFLKETTYRFNTENFVVGLSIFTVGLAKKVLIADRFAALVPLAFDNSTHLSRVVAWRCVISYFIQLYFDFSGYSEMAIGLARMFNVTFPANFDSPYKAPSIIEFWQRWHMSLTRYVNLYVYNPIALAITRARYAKGKPANAAALRTVDGFASMVVLPTMITMVLIGVWHGSGLQFLVFGLLHGFYLCIAHAWRLVKGKVIGEPASKLERYGRIGISVLITCLAVLFAQVYFRAHDVGEANRIIAAMTFWPTAPHPSNVDLKDWAMIIGALLFVWTLPNTLQIFAAERPALAKSRAKTALISFNWRPSPVLGVCFGLLFLYAFMCVSGTSAFLYFRF